MGMNANPLVGLMSHCVSYVYWSPTYLVDKQEKHVLWWEKDTQTQLQYAVMALLVFR